MSDQDAVRRAVEDAHRREWALVLAAAVRVTGDLDLAQECAQEAFAAALASWGDGVPARPGAWLTTTARRRAVDAVRREATLRSKLPLLVEPLTAPDDPAAAVVDASEGAEVPDDRLRLVFTCCHPALSPEARVALTLRLVCGLSTAEVAQAFLVPEATMAARITRAKKKIAGARIPYRVPRAPELPERLDGVLTVVHLLFTTGHTAPSGAALVREDLAERAIALARLLVELMPDEREARGLLALLLLTHSRRAARQAADGRLVLLEDQDRTLWDSTAVREGLALVPGTLRGPSVGRFAVQAAIAAVHAEAASYQDADWRQVLGLYDVLARVWPSPVVELNRAVALAEVRGPEAALAEVERLAADGRLAGYRYLPATRADLLRRLGRAPEAVAAYTEALALADNDAERDFLTRRIASLS